MIKIFGKVVLPTSIVDGGNTGAIRIRSYYDISYNDIFYDGIMVGLENIATPNTGFTWTGTNFIYND